MPRRPRLVIAGIPLHLTQRGVTRAAVFLDRQDHRLYHDLLAETLASNGSSVHAYALMSNHVHLFISPTSAGNLARAMRILNQRSGTLWESRFRSCLVDSERYALERALGSPTFQAMVARTLNRPVAVRPRGRPRAQDKQDSNG